MFAYLHTFITNNSMAILTLTHKIIITIIIIIIKEGALRLITHLSYVNIHSFLFGLKTVLHSTT
jgi:hypothetical protein